jgi:hypothetical protein
MVAEDGVIRVRTASCTPGSGYCCRYAIGFRVYGHDEQRNQRVNSPSTSTRSPSSTVDATEPVLTTISGSS